MTSMFVKMQTAPTGTQGVVGALNPAAIGSTQARTNQSTKTSETEDERSQTAQKIPNQEAEQTKFSAGKPK